MSDTTQIFDKCEKTGYLQKHFRLFHIEDMNQREFAYHYHDFDKIICFLGGRVDYMIEGKNYSLEPYDFVLVNRNEIHRPEVDFSIPYERKILYIEHDFLERYREADYDLTECFQRAREQKANVLHFPARVTSRLCETLKRLEECVGQSRYAGDLSIDRLAERFYMSKYHMMRQFKEETGYSIHQYISEKRLLAAKALLQEGMSAGAAALECGFRDYSAFARAFKKRTGMASSEV